MSNRIGRKICVVTCECVVVDEQNNTRHEQVTLYGDYTNDARIQNAVKRKLGIERVLVERYNKETFYASMPMEKFLKEATVTRREN